MASPRGMTPIRSGEAARPRASARRKARAMPTSSAWRCKPRASRCRSPRSRAPQATHVAFAAVSRGV